MGGGEKRKEKIKKIKKERGTETEGERDKDSLHLSISWLRFYFTNLTIYRLPYHLKF